MNAYLSLNTHGYMDVCRPVCVFVFRQIFVVQEIHSSTMLYMCAEVPLFENLLLAE